MVFRGKPSKACQRCRVRRLKCDLQSITCGQCVRACATCSGYPTQQLRIVNVVPQVPRPPFSVDMLARNALFTYLTPSISKYWEFLKRSWCVTESPDHLTLAIEAVSLAYLWHDVYSDAALARARKKYISALSVLGKVLKSPSQASEDATLVATLLLDLFEKITNLRYKDNKSWTCHVNGGLSLVRLRSLEQFKDSFSMRILVRLVTNHTNSCVVSGSPVPDEVFTIRAFFEKHVDVQTPHWKIQDLLVHYANLRSRMKRGMLSRDELIGTLLALDKAFQDIERKLPESWQFATTILSEKSDSVFNLLRHNYPNRDVCQGWNGLRLIRILLNESLSENYFTSSTTERGQQLKARAQENIHNLAHEICASVPQYMDCTCTAQQKLQRPETSKSLLKTSSNVEHVRGLNGPPHTPDHLLDCYTLIFPLYIAGRSQINLDMGPWVISKLNFLASHFHIRSAKVVAQILERKADTDPWEIYALIGSYAFAA